MLSLFLLSILCSLWMTNGQIITDSELRMHVLNFPIFHISYASVCM